MSSIDKKYYETAKDYGRKSYRTADEDSFREFMSKKTIFMYDAYYKAPWSEFEKPYFEDSYEGMEQYLQNPPGFPWDWQDWPFDNPSWPPGYDIPEGGGGFSSLTVFWCSISGCFCPGDTKTVTADCSHPIMGIHLADPTARISKEFSISGKGGGTTAQIEISASEDAGGAVEIDIDMNANGIRGSHDSIMVSSCSECDPNCDEVTPVTLSYDDNGEVVPANGYTVVTCRDGKGPFSWSVTGSGVEVLYPVTTGRSTMLKSTDCCGRIVVTVTDACDNAAEIEMRGENGRWDFLGSTTVGGACGCTDSVHYTCAPAAYAPSNPWYPLPGIKIADSNCFLGYCCCLYRDDGLPVGRECYPMEVDSGGYYYCWNPCGEKTNVQDGSIMRTDVWIC